MCCCGTQADRSDESAKAKSSVKVRSLPSTVKVRSVMQPDGNGRYCDCVCTSECTNERHRSDACMRAQANKRRAKEGKSDGDDVPRKKRFSSTKQH